MLLSSRVKGNKGPRLLPEIASLVNVWWFVVYVLPLWEEAGCAACFMVAACFNVCIQAGLGRSRVHSWSLLLKAGAQLSDKDLYQRRAFMWLLSVGKKRYAVSLKNSSLSFSHFFQVCCVSSLNLAWLLCDERNAVLALHAERELFGTVSDRGSMWGAVAAALAAPWQGWSWGRAVSVVQQTTANQPSLPQGRKDLRRIKVHNLKTTLGPVLPCNTLYTAVFVYPLAQSVSPRSERIPPDMLLFWCSRLAGRPGWGCVMYFVTKLLFVVAVSSSWGVCFQKQPLPLCDPVRRLFPQKLEHCGWWLQAEEGHDQPPKKRRVLRKEAAAENWQLCLQGAVLCCGCALQQQGAPGLGATSTHAVIGGESISCAWRWLFPCCSNLLVWNSADMSSAALVPSHDKWAGAMAISTPPVFQYTL